MMPFPRDDTTPPVTNMNFGDMVMGDVYEGGFCVFFFWLVWYLSLRHREVRVHHYVHHAKVLPGLL